MVLFLHRNQKGHFRHLRAGQKGQWWPVQGKSIENINLRDIQATARSVEIVPVRQNEPVRTPQNIFLLERIQKRRTDSRMRRTDCGNLQESPRAEVTTIVLRRGRTFRRMATQV